LAAGLSACCALFASGALAGSGCGLASWYGLGGQTASGEYIDPVALTAAHRTLPFGTRVKVENLDNGRSVVVRINDRGPFIGDRVIDLSYTAAYKLGLLAGGSAMVEVESILPGDPAPAKVAVAATPAASAPPDAVPQAAAKPLPIQAAAPEPAPIAVPLPAPEASPPAPATAAPAAEPRAANGVYVQFGAFRLRENAESYLARLKQQFGWLAARLHVAPRDGLYRVHAGPYPNQTEARHIANRIGDSLGPRPILLHW
jgi:rare lipoprotein A